MCKPANFYELIHQTCSASPSSSDEVSGDIMERKPKPKWSPEEVCETIKSAGYSHFAIILG